MGAPGGPSADSEAQRGAATDGLQPEVRLLRVRNQVRQAGERTSALRLNVFGWPFGIWLLVLMTALVGGLAAGAFPAFGGLVVLGLGGLGVCAGLAVLAAAFFRRLKRRALADALRPLSPHEQRQVLLALQDDPVPDTRRLAADLLRDVGLPSEISPAVSPEGRGSEVSGEAGAERERHPD